MKWFKRTAQGRKLSALGIDQQARPERAAELLIPGVNRTP
jgi:hypothetical protein